VSEDAFVVPTSAAATDEERQLSLEFLDKLARPFVPSQHRDLFRLAVDAATSKKIETGSVRRYGIPQPIGQSDAPVLNLAGLLRRSVEAAATDPANAQRPGVRKARARKPSASKRKPLEHV
jgi:non-homologous end joining protein Ku